MKIYALLFDRRPIGNYSAFHKALVAHPRIERWWHYLKSSYLIGTDLSANDLSNHVTACARQAGIPVTHLVVQVDIRKRQGMLNPKAWTWFKAIKVEGTG